MSKKESPSFEELLKQLEDITEKLETGNISLKESMELYEKGVKLKNQCEEQLLLAESKWTQLEKKEDGGYAESTLDLDTLASDRKT